MTATDTNLCTTCIHHRIDHENQKYRCMKFGCRCSHYSVTILYESGAQRDSIAPAYHSITPHELRRLALIYAVGNKKYGDDNYQKGLPFSVLYNHAMEHLQLYRQGDRTEDHLAKAAWGMFALMYMETNRPEMNDF